MLRAHGEDVYAADVVAPPTHINRARGPRGVKQVLEWRRDEVSTHQGAYNVAGRGMGSKRNAGTPHSPPEARP